jgi:tRNA-2-methylthio-N6-dimethylallyladenosine synthase
MAEGLVKLRLGRGLGDRAPAGAAGAPNAAADRPTSPNAADRPTSPSAAAAATEGPRLYLETYGCQMNEADSDLIASLLGRGGYTRTDRPDLAQLIVVNTCAVREKAEERVFARASELGALKRRRPGTVLAITGCMAEHLKERLVERAPWVDIVAGPDSYRRLGDLVERARARQADADAEVRHEALLDVHLDKLETYEGLDATPDGDGITGFVTIQRGCDKFCTFCVVPLTRGRERGAAPREILRQVRALVQGGVREVTLLGQTVNSYRHEQASFAQLLGAVAQVPGLERVRFTSPYPVDFSADVIAAIASEPKVCKHVHLPLQAGADRVLERMRRGYTVLEFERIVADLRAAIPGIVITTDILVGFSGETDAEHDETVRAMERIRFDAAFMFAYSEREGTFAARKLPDDVPEVEKKRRLAQVIALQERISAEQYAAQIGKTERVLLHKVAKRHKDQLIGRTDGFRAVVIDRDDHAPGDLVDVHIERSTSATLFGTVVGAPSRDSARP